jgi:hypothetical protein
MIRENSKKTGTNRKKKLRKDRVALAAFIVLLLPGIFIYRGISRNIQASLNPKAVGTVKVDRYKDLNDKQLVWAKKHGITPFKTNQSFHDKKHELLSDGKLEKIKNSRHFIVDRLTYSQPYLVPEAAKLLDDIGDRFGDKLDDHDKGRYFFKVSSLLRTQESQKALSKSNVNASENSTHLYGTTFDIPYSHVVKQPLPWKRKEIQDADIIKLLSETIGEFRKEGRCLVVTEYKQKCFHITVVK